MNLKLKVVRRRAFFLDNSSPAERLRVWRVTKPISETPFDTLLWKKHLCITNVARDGKTLAGYVVRSSVAYPHFNSYEALKGVDCYGEVCYIGAAVEEEIIQIGELQ